MTKKEAMTTKLKPTIPVTGFWMRNDIKGRVEVLVQHDGEWIVVFGKDGPGPVACDDDQTIDHMIHAGGVQNLLGALKKRDDEITTLKAIAQDDHERRVRDAQAQLARLRVAEAVRDDARAASQRYLDEKRGLRAQLEQRQAHVAVQPARMCPYCNLEEGHEGAHIYLIDRHTIGGEDLSPAATAHGDERKKVDDITIKEFGIGDATVRRHLDKVAANEQLRARIAELTAQKDAAYSERDRCVAGLAALAMRLGWSCWLGRHVGEPWDHDWRTIVFINLPTGQVSWHIHDSEVPWFSFLPTILERPWDGHTTDQKYKRLAQLGVGRIESYDQQPKHSSKCGTMYRGCAPGCAFAAAQADPLAAAIENEVNKATHPSHPARIAYDRVYEVMGNDGTPEERSALFWKTLRDNQADGGGPTLGGEDLSLDPAVRLEQIRAVVMGEPLSNATEAALEAMYRQMRELPNVTRRDDGAYTAGPPPDGRSVDEHLDELTRCACSPKYRELAPGVHATYCPLAGRPL